MAGPTTEAVNEDLKSLRDDLHQLETSLKEDIHNVSVSLAELRAEVRVSLAVIKWAGALLVTTILTGGVAGVWWASGITSEVKHLADVVGTLKP